MQIRLQDVEKILVNCDPEGLIRLGAPPDEYSSEASDIFVFLLENPTASRLELVHEIRRVFYLSFYECLFDSFDSWKFQKANKCETYEIIANQIWKLIII